MRVFVPTGRGLRRDDEVLLERVRPVVRPSTTSRQPFAADSHGRHHLRAETRAIGGGEMGDVASDTRAHGHLVESLRGPVEMGCAQGGVSHDALADHHRGKDTQGRDALSIPSYQMHCYYYCIV
jgi:hypothetical protein